MVEAVPVVPALLAAAWAGSYSAESMIESTAAPHRVGSHVCWYVYFDFLDGHFDFLKLCITLLLPSLTILVASFSFLSLVVHDPAARNLMA